MTFDIDIMYQKESTILHVDAQSRLEFINVKVENHDNAKGKILRSVETDVLPLNRLRIKIRQDPV